MLKMTREEKEVYEFALKLKRNEGTFSQRGCRILADYIAKCMVEPESVQQIIKADPGSVVKAIRQTIIK